MGMELRFLIVEDDADLGSALRKHLHNDGHAADLVVDGGAADEILRYQSYEMVVLDIGLPVLDGHEVLKALRRRGDLTPVLVLTARSGVENRIDTLDIGADDYLSKPFDFRELDARCRSLLRRSQGVASSVTTVGGLSFDRAAKIVTLNGQGLSLPMREYRLLEIFLSNLGRILSKEQIASQLFDFEDETGENAIELYVGRLRRKLGENALVIRTQRGLGYLAQATDDPRA